MSIPNLAVPLSELIAALQKMPGIGQRSAQRIAYHLLQYDQPSARRLSQALTHALDELQHCARCNGFSTEPICRLCQNPTRDATRLCVVDTPPDQNVIENSHGYNGLYYILMGSLRPLEGIGPEEMDFAQLLTRAGDGVVREVVLANGYTAEGETTAHYLGELLRQKGLKVTRIARGIPAGSELEYVDAGTIAWAFQERKDLS